MTEAYVVLYHTFYVRPVVPRTGTATGTDAEGKITEYVCSNIWKFLTLAHEWMATDGQYLCPLSISSKLFGDTPAY